MVSVMTLHGAKGLEFDTVFLPGWEEGLFPNQRALDEGGRRRSRRSAGWPMSASPAPAGAHISFAANRRVYNQWSVELPSRFVDELPAAHIEHPAAPLRHARPARAVLDEEPFAPPASRFRSRRAEPAS